MQHAIYPGRPWLDTKGERIQAHGAQVIYENGTYYWIGENKELTSEEKDIWTWGIRCYSSRDLYNWQDEGLIIPPEPENPESILHPSRKLDRPHILYNRAAKRYVCWLKYCDTNHFAVLTAEKLLGPYTIVNPFLQPYGKQSGDYDLALNPATGDGYLYYEADHNAVLAARLNADYTDVTGEPVTIYADQHPPFTREGVTHFIRAGKHYLVTSGMTGYMPNPSEVAVADDWLGPYTVQGDPHVNDDSRASFNSQISGVFQVAGRDLYIAIADRWVPDYPVTAELYERLARVVESNFDKSIQVSQEDVELLLASPMVRHSDTSKANYVWLPIIFTADGKMQIRWLDEFEII